MPIHHEGTQVRMLSEWFDKLHGTAMDTPVYVFQGEKEGGSVLIIGSAHPNEIGGTLSAFVLIENAVTESGTVYVIPYANRSASANTLPGDGTLQSFTLTTASGEREFRYGSRLTDPVDQWPDPSVYTHFSSGQQLSGSDVRNLNRAFPGRPDGNITERAAYAITQLIITQNIDLVIDMHEASPEYPVVNAVVAHERAMPIASYAVINMLSHFNVSLESSPVNLNGLSHRELGDFTNAYVVLTETTNPSQGRLRGATTTKQVLSGKDRFYVINAGLGMLYVPFDDMGHPVEERVGRQLQGVIELISAFNNVHPERAIKLHNVPGYTELFTNALAEDLGGTHLAKFLR